MVFLSYLQEYLLQKDEGGLLKKLSDPMVSPKEKDEIVRKLRLNNFYGEIIMLGFCLMQNHFHFFVKQKSAGSIDKFMNSLGTRYTMYFNKKYQRVGSLYQGVYKAVLVSNDEQFLHLSRYIHKQALPNQPSSYLTYLGKERKQWIYPEEILAYFAKTNPLLSYEAFINQTEDFEIIQDVLLEE